MEIKVVEDLAPDQASLKAASKLTKPGKWSLRSKDNEARILWGECQGSGANPYRVMADTVDLGYKCTCPSRKFPCKHVLALMWMFAENPDDFSSGSIPDWVKEWMGRRRKKSQTPESDSNSKAEPSKKPKSISQALKEPEVEKTLDPAVLARKAKAAQTRKEQAQKRLLDGLEDLENWISDQLRLGLKVLLQDPTTHCRKIAARLVDASATTLAGRIDELPSKLMGLSPEKQPVAVVMELSAWMIAIRKYRMDPDNQELKSELAQAIRREELEDNESALVVDGYWEVIGESVVTQRDGLVRQSTWLWQLNNENRFALLLDYYPAATGKKSGSFSPGDQFEARIIYYPAKHPLRGIISERKTGKKTDINWPELSNWSSSAITKNFQLTPWSYSGPVALPKGRIGMTSKGYFKWSSSQFDLELSLTEPPPKGLLGVELQQAIIIWDGLRAQLLATQTELGPCYTT